MAFMKRGEKRVEIWRPVKGYEGLYVVSDRGRVKSLPRTDKRGHKRNERILKQNISAWGYKFVVFGDNKSRVVHRLVATAFIQNNENKPEVNHINGVKTDNRLENLEWVTHSENMKHACETGLKFIPRGEKVYNARLTYKDAAKIRNMYKTGEWTYQRLSSLFNVSLSVIQNVINNKTYRIEESC
jgi:hypothetical protein